MDSPPVPATLEIPYQVRPPNGSPGGPPVPFPCRDFLTTVVYRPSRKNPCRIPGQYLRNGGDDGYCVSYRNKEGPHEYSEPSGRT